MDLPLPVGTGGLCINGTLRQRGVVDQNGSGDTLTISDAMARAGSGAILSIYPGTYAENLIIDQPVHLKAARIDDPPFVAPENGPCLTATVDGGSVVGLRMTALAAPAERRNTYPMSHCEFRCTGSGG